MVRKLLHYSTPSKTEDLPETTREDLPPSIDSHGDGEEANQTVQGYQHIDHGVLGLVQDEPEQGQVHQEYQDTSSQTKEDNSKILILYFHL